ncbi:MAG: DEAD/DEAH box helicase [Eubacterium sp.]|nr:DEAD/DEAH box helicase [Eubacterium sp.]
MNNCIDKIKSGATTAFIDSTYKSNAAYKPSFISNDHTNGVKVMTTIEDELRKCESFVFSVAFITLGGITPLLQTLKELEEKGIPGRVLTTDYNNFTDPKALDKLAELKNIELRMYREEAVPFEAYETADGEKTAVDTERIGFHTKGYIFKNDGTFTILIGSSNMTQKALSVNKEWNTKVISTAEGEMYQTVSGAFDKLWNDRSHTRTYEEFIDEYRTKYETIKRQRKIALEAAKNAVEVDANSSEGNSQNKGVISLEQYRLKPNSMQVDFINNLSKLIDDGEDKALLISATGTGKTYASAFGVRDALNKIGANERVLFVVHREQIAKQAMKSYKMVFGNTRKFGLLSGNNKDMEADFLFATMQMMAKEEVMQQYEKNHFQTIIIDEAHRSGANSYQKIMDYFKPMFWLGMTASPERTDDFDVFATFDHNIALEIRLQQAMEEDLLCPFHYFGITDFTIDGEAIDEKTMFNKLVSDTRVDYIIKQIKYYGYSGDRVKGLVFCSSKNEAIKLSEIFNTRGYRTTALTGDDSQEKRERAIEQLTKDDGDDYLDYIFTVDIFNEGVDIPEINQVIMLRPTESPIVFVQQLGRGLRNSTDKEFVVILDFIGNYKNNFMIPIALSGDRTYNKDNIRRYVAEGEKVIPGASTIHFDEISKKKIYAAIDSANFSDVKLIKENYKNLKNKLGRIPKLMDFDRYGEMDVFRIFDNNTLGSYYKFLVKYENDYKIRLSEDEEKAVEFISKKLANGKRIHELELLSRMLEYKTGLISGLKSVLKNRYSKECTTKEIKSVINVMTNEFPSGSGKKTYDMCVFIEKDNDGDYKISQRYQSMLNHKEFYDIVKELVEFGRYRYQRDYSKNYRDTELVLYQKYTYEDACRLLNWEHNEVPLNIGGYKFDKETNTFPVFINYDKAEDIQDTIKYEDHFVSRDSLIAISKQSRTVESEDVQNFIHAVERGISVELFVRKNKDDKASKEFYYLGRMKATGDTTEFVMANTDKTAVEIGWKLDTPVREDIYEYIVNG